MGERDWPQPGAHGPADVRHPGPIRRHRTGVLSQPYGHDQRGGLHGIPRRPDAGGGAEAGANNRRGEFPREASQGGLGAGGKKWEDRPYRPFARGADHVPGGAAAQCDGNVAD